MRLSAHVCVWTLKVMCVKYYTLSRFPKWDVWIWCFNESSAQMVYWSQNLHYIIVIPVLNGMYLIVGGSVRLIKQSPLVFHRFVKPNDSRITEPSWIKTFFPVLLIGKYLLLSILPGCLLVLGITGIEFTPMPHTFLPSSTASHSIAAGAAGFTGSAHCLRAETGRPAVVFYKVKAAEVLM